MPEETLHVAPAKMFDNDRHSVLMRVELEGELVWFVDTVVLC